MKTKCKEKPILFSGPMVRAILDNRKTQTRRVVKYKHPATIMEDECGKPWPFFDCYVFGTDEPVKAKCPYGEIGSRLWVRESINGIFDCDAFYLADQSNLTDSLGWDWVHGEMAKKLPVKVIPSIHMPRWASRITMEITGIRVERAAEITIADLIAEGVWELPEGWIGNQSDQAKLHSEAFTTWNTLWNGINGKKHPLEANPYVWVVEFKRVEETK